MFVPYNTDAPLYHWPLVTVGLIVLNTVLFIGIQANRFASHDSAFAGGDESAQVHVFTTGHQEGGSALLLEYGKGLKPIQWFTSPFMHADIVHLIGNMIFLWAFGLVVEGKVGSPIFLALYMAIAVGQSALEQSMMVFADGGASLGASAAIFGLLGIAIIWAPSNNFDVLWFFMLRGGHFEIPILIYGFITLCFEGISVVLSQFSVTSSFLHLMGLAMGMSLGYIWLRKDWVDCEGWDLVNVVKGREGMQNVEEQDKVEAAASALLKSARKSMRPETPMPVEKGAKNPQRPDEYAPQQATTQSAQDSVNDLIRAENFAVAVKMISKLRKSGSDFQLAQPVLFKLIRGLLASKHFAAALPFMVEHVQQFSAGRQTLQLNMAKVLIHLERPKKAMSVLNDIDANLLDDAGKSTRKKLFDHAQQLHQSGMIELSE